MLPQRRLQPVRVKADVVAAVVVEAFEVGPSFAELDGSS